MRPRHVRSHLSQQYNLRKKKKHFTLTHSQLPLLPSRHSSLLISCFTPNLHHRRTPPHKSLFSSLPSRQTATHRNTDRCSPLFLHAELPPPPHRSPTGAHRHKFRRSYAWSLETNRSYREPQSKGLFFMIFPFPQFGFRIGCSEFLFASSESFKF